jgi:hypothetical protein
MSPDLIAASFTVLRKNRQLIVFPVLSAISALLVAVAFASFGLLSHFSYSQVRHLGTGSYAFLFAWYCCSAFGVIFFNCALAACAQESLSGNHPTVAFGLGRAIERIGPIFLWAILTSTVGIILRSIERRVPFAGKIAVWIFGAAWGMATYLVVPVLIAEDRGTLDSIRRSAQLLRDTWGPQLTAGIRFGWRFLLLIIPGVILGAIGVNYYLPVMGLAFLYIVMLVAVFSAANGIFEMALYRYAAGGAIPADWSPNSLSGAFRPRRS